MEETPPTVAKILVLGDPSVGKTSLIESLSFTGTDIPNQIEPLLPTTELLLETERFVISKKIFDITKDMVMGSPPGIDKTLTSHLSNPEAIEDYEWVSSLPPSCELRFWEPQKTQSPKNKWEKLRGAIMGKHVDTLVGELRDGVLKAGTSDTAEVEIFRNSACVLIMFDVTNMKSFFSAIGHHYKKVKKLIPESTIILVAGKGDLTLRQVVEEEEIERFCVKEGIFFVHVSVLTKMSINMLQTMIKIQVLGLLRANEGNSLYDLDDLLVIGEGDIDAEFFLKHHDDSHLRRHKSVYTQMDVADESVMEAFEGLVVPERDFTNVEATLGRFRLDPCKGVEMKGDALEKALKALTTRVHTIREGAEEDEREVENGWGGDAWAEPKDIGVAELREAFGLLGRSLPAPGGAAPNRSGAGGERKGMGASSLQNGTKASAKKSVGGTSRDTPRVVKLKQKGGKKKVPSPKESPKDRVPDLRIKVGLPGGKVGALVVYPGDNVVDLAKRFIVQNNLPNTDKVTENLCKKINLATKKKAELDNQPHSSVQANHKVLGRLEVELASGTKRSIVLREGDDPRLIVEAFSSRHVGEVGKGQKKELVKILSAELEKRSKAKKRVGV
ncbi:hypothetical protein TL16_g08299 [Triparma laevis f. inornata]|uniref:Uncharacterized protein n=1 Tax=Triparma laevis f. inornata TaxID=1714386 RepID=A0A9W7EIF8_9STRA|nr:hypothetical protein TL16_g08299 [Triparma laevis f. inornata]